METKFTPGPWKAGKNPYMTTVLDGHEGKAIYMDEPNDPHHIAWANAENTEGELDIETALANATLIAAAPELYEACRFHCETRCKMRNLNKNVCKNCLFGKALRKARGESEVK